LSYKRPESVLAVVYTASDKCLLLQRADQPDFWQSVTGSLNWQEQDPAEAVRRELFEETGLPIERIDNWRRVYVYPILPAWRSRYHPRVRFNFEHVFVVPLAEEKPVRLNPAEHRASAWLDFTEAEARASSWTNRNVIRELHRLRQSAAGDA
jgi:dATP pyrophosphohydrolase